MSSDKGGFTMYRKLAGLFFKHGYGLLMYPGAYYPKIRDIGMQVPFPKPEEIPTLVLPSNLDERFGIVAESDAEARKKRRKRKRDRQKARGKDKIEFVVETVELRTKDGVTLRAYLAKGRKNTDRPKGTIIFFHGNGVTPELMADTFEILLTHLDFWIFAVSYRGYGHSGGLPSEKGLSIDAQTALDYVLRRRDDLGDLVIVYGHSLGGAVAIDVVSKNSDKVHALIIENTFTSIPKLMSRFSSLRPFLWTVRQKWESYKKLWKIRRGLPILMLSGIKDDVIPPEEMLILLEISKKRPGSPCGCSGGITGRGLGLCLGSCWKGGWEQSDEEILREEGVKAKSQSQPNLLSTRSTRSLLSPTTTTTTPGGGSLDKVEAEARKSAMEFYEKVQWVSVECGNGNGPGSRPISVVSIETGVGTPGGSGSRPGTAAGAGAAAAKGTTSGKGGEEARVVTPEDKKWYEELVAKWMGGAERDVESGVEIKYFPSGDHMSTFAQAQYIPTISSFLDRVVESERVAPTPSSSIKLR